MSLSGNCTLLSQCIKRVLCHPRTSLRRILGPPGSARATAFVESIADRCDRRSTTTQPAAEEPANNPLQVYFDGVVDGPGIWKWLHYFDVYHRHLEKYRGREVTIVEIGVYSGGSMPMWRTYLGDRCQVHGVDIQEECKVYADANTTIHIGDQADRAFWKRFRQAVPKVDIVIDDGGHQPEQQMVAVEELLTHIQPGGVYVCEDIHGVGNQFAEFVHCLADHLNACYFTKHGDEDESSATPFQTSVHSLHFYPFLTVIEKTDDCVSRFRSMRRGTMWQPFL